MLDMIFGFVFGIGVGVVVTLALQAYEKHRLLKIVNKKDKLNALKRLADNMYYAAQMLTTDASRLRMAMEEYHNFIVLNYNEN